MSENKKEGSIYELDGRVKLSKALPLGIQHVLAMFLGNITPLLIVCGALEMDSSSKTMLIQNSMFIAGIATLIQLYPIWKIGSGLPVVMGTSSGFIGTAKVIGLASGYGAILGASMIGALIEMVLGFFIKPLRKIFAPVVTSLVVLSIGLSLLPVGIKYLGGGETNSLGFGHWKHLLVGFLVIVVIVVLKQFQGSFLSVSSILIGIIVGYIAAIFLGMVDFTQVKEAAWFAIPRPVMLIDGIGIKFVPSAIIAMAIMFIATAVETIGDTSAIVNGGLDREPTNEELSGSVIADGFGSLIAAVFGVLPNTSFSQNVGLVKVVNRFTIMTGAVFLVAMGFLPKLSALFTVMPQSVLGGAAVIMFAMIIVSGLTSLQRLDLNGRNGLIIALALGLGVGIGNVPTVLDQMPQWVGDIFAQNGIIMTFVIATVLNLVLPKDKEEKGAE